MMKVMHLRKPLLVQDIWHTVFVLISAQTPNNRTPPPFMHESIMMKVMHLRKSLLVQDIWHTVFIQISAHTPYNCSLLFLKNVERGKPVDIIFWPYEPPSLHVPLFGQRRYPNGGVAKIASTSCELSLNQGLQHILNKGTVIPPRLLGMTGLLLVCSVSQNGSLSNCLKIYFGNRFGGSCHFAKFWNFVPQSQSSGLVQAREFFKGSYGPVIF